MTAKAPDLRRKTNLPVLWSWYARSDCFFHMFVMSLFDDGREVRPSGVGGLDAIVRGMQLALPDDETLIGHTDAIYEGLYAYLSRHVL